MQNAIWSLRPLFFWGIIIPVILGFYWFLLVFLVFYFSQKLPSNSFLTIRKESVKE